MKRKICLVLALFLALQGVSSAGFGEEGPDWKVYREETGTGGQGSCAYPVFEWSRWPYPAQQVNETVFREAELEAYLALAGQIGQGGQGLKVDYTLFTGEDSPVLSLVLSAKGRMPFGRPTQKWYPFVFDLSGGGRMAFEALFADPDAAKETIETYVEAELEEGLSDYMENRDLLPVPYDRFALCGEGLLFYYEYGQFSFLSGYSGQILIPWYVLDGLPGADGPDWRTALGVQTVPDGTSRARILEEASAGRIPGVPLQIGDPAQQVLEEGRCILDPGIWYVGSSFEAEDARLYGTLLLTDAAEETLAGICCERVNMAGIIAGRTAPEEYRSVLGEPDRTWETEEDGQYAPLFGAGRLDLYRAGEFDLILYTREGTTLDGVLLVDGQKG